MKSVLYVTHRVPWPLNRGDRIRTFNIIKYLGERCRLHVASLADEPCDTHALSNLSKHCAAFSVIPATTTRWMSGAISFAAGRTATAGLFASAGMRRLIRDWSQDVKFDAALASSSGVAQYLDCETLTNARKWVDLIDVDSQKWIQYSRTSNPVRSWLYQREGQRLRQLEMDLADRHERLSVVTDAEVALFRSFYDGGSVCAIPNGVDTDYFTRPPGSGEELKCVFLGVLDYKPNVDGVVWFARNVWPKVREQNPTAVFEIVGRSPSVEVKALSAIDGVRVVGPVDDVRPYLWSAAVVVAPLLIARGVQNKLLEAFAASRAVIATPQALTGIEAQPGTHAICAESPEQWIGSVNQLFRDKVLRNNLASASRDWVLEHHRWETCLKGFDDLLHSRASSAADSLSVAHSQEQP